MLRTTKDKILLTKITWNRKDFGPIEVKVMRYVALLTIENLTFSTNFNLLNIKAANKPKFITTGNHGMPIIFLILSHYSKLTRIVVKPAHPL